MARRVTDKDIKLMNELYVKYGTYAAVAREVGFAPSTVKRYITPNYQPVVASNIKRVTLEEMMNRSIKDYLDKGLQDMFEMSAEEWAALEELARETL